jgi:hypothetical protein
VPQPLIVQDVERLDRAAAPLTEVSPKEAIEGLVNGPVESCSEYHGNVVACPFHPFVGALHAAFMDHRPLVLSPDMFWLLIAQGFAAHVNNNAEKDRSQFVSHEGKEEIIVERHDFIKGSPENPWSEVFDEFSRCIRKKIGEDNHSQIVVDFSTTGPIEKAANEVVLLDAMKNYFNFTVFTRCGIPQVTLQGTKEDWAKLRDRTDALGKRYELEWWTERLLPTLDMIADNAAGADNPELWRNIYKWNSRSGGDVITGWITDFFPYASFWDSDTNGRVLKRLYWHDCDEEGRLAAYTVVAPDGRSSELQVCGPFCTNMLPGSLSKVPFKWRYFADKFSMEFIAGFTSFTQDTETMAVRPKIGWAVREKN